MSAGQAAIGQKPRVSGGRRMGLDFMIQGVEPDYEKNAHWSYSGFNRFRTKIAALLGIQLDAMSGFGGITAWTTFEDDPIHIFLNHSDCDGKLLPEECAKIAPRLKALIAKLDEEWDRESGILLTDMMDKCVEADRPLIFC